MVRVLLIFTFAINTAVCAQAVNAGDYARAVVFALICLFLAAIVASGEV